MSTAGYRHVTMVAAALALTLPAAGCGASADAGGAAATTAPPPQEGSEPTADKTMRSAEADGSASERPGGEVEDGTFAAVLGDVDDSTVVVDEIEVLAGEEAVVARSEDGEAPVEEGVDQPYLRNRDEVSTTIPVASAVVVAVYDCSQACEHVEWSYADLVAGTPLPYGGAEAPFMVTMQDGEVVELAEIYLP